MIVFLAAAVAGCDGPRCREVESGGERYCIASSPAVIEGGITCPADLPFELELERGIVCSASPLALEDLPPEICAMLGGCEAPPPISRDGGTMDAAPPDPGVPVGVWSALPDAPHARAATCATSGSRIGYFGGSTGPSVASSSIAAAGAELDVTTATWRVFPTAGEPSPRTGVALAATDSGWFVFSGDGGGGALEGGAFLADGESAWRPLPLAGAPSPRTFVVSAWTGREVLVWGGAAGAVPAALGDGAAFDPSTSTWRPIATVGAPAPRMRAASVWTGTELVIFGGQDRGVLLRDGAAYEPVADQWRPITTANAPIGRGNAVSAWTGTYVVVWGGADATGPRRDGGAYDPLRDAWRTIPSIPADLVPIDAVDLGGGLAGSMWIVWGARDDTFAASTGAAFDLDRWSWRPLVLEGAPAPRRDDCVVSTGHGVAVLLGATRDRFLRDGARVETAP